METKELKPGTLKHLQEYITYKMKERGFEDETLHERLLLLAEEVGELIHASRRLSGMNVDQRRENTEDIGEEITDVINMIFCVAIKFNLNVEKEYYKKEKIINKRFYQRTEKKV
ncbi:hypothetical protein HQ544_01330 [Candidatus Falkowbacteria bacterium]|nr:hypothetical protein [Candidatus Falkowbacteria bacterium]